ncbi:hypothetical protein L208DRAFT_1292181 [Tricholoma matsutake]|nr:hypothetical protein L208DRAFT_1292181 [Tricholoma matsutake 945]
MSDVEAAARAKLQSLRKDSIAFCLLNALLANAPTVEGVEVIATDIIDASEQSDGLDQLAEFYKTGLLLPMKAGGRTPQVSFHPSRDPEIKSEANAIAIDLETTKRDPTTLKKYSLHRDGYRCVATRRWDYSSLSLPHVKEKFDPIDEATITEAAHILPFSLMSVDTNKTLFKKCTIWSVIKSFTNIEFTELSGDYINSLTNVITLDALLHKSFGLLHLWFEAVPGMNNSYIVRKANDYFMPGIVKDGTRVAFTSFSPENLPLPDPRYLAFHAAISKVVHMVGMAEHLDEILRKYEDIRVLSDQSSVEYLDGLLCTTQKCINNLMQLHSGQGQ